MKSAALHSQEKKRLEKLKSYSILDTQPEDKFDLITKLASMICETEISVVSLVDEHRQWFKSSVGLSVCETSRDVSFCSHAILVSDIMEVEDTHKDERFSDNPFVTGEPHIRFYAGVPLFTKEKLPLGTLCVIDSKPKKLTDVQKQMLMALSRHVTDFIELNYRNNLLETSMKEKEEISASFVAQQRSLIAEARRFLANGNLAVRHDPNHSVSFEADSESFDLGQLIDDLIVQTKPNRLSQKVLIISNIERGIFIKANKKAVVSSLNKLIESSLNAFKQQNLPFKLITLNAKQVNSIVFIEYSQNCPALQDTQVSFKSANENYQSVFTLKLQAA